jgi:CSLREA domain-containing protein
MLFYPNNLLKLLIPSVIASLFLIGNVRATVLTVTTAADSDDSICDSQCSLREAIEVAAPGDTIIFAVSLRGQVLVLDKALVIEKRLTIDGPNKRRITLKGNGNGSILEIKAETTNVVVSIDGLIISDGQALNSDGGGIYVNPIRSVVLNITNCALLNNSAQRGGGIYMNNGTLYLINSTVANNKATAASGGGGIDITRTTVRIMNSTISGNISTSAVDGVGGLRLTNSENWFINSSTISYNSSNGTSQLSVGGLLATNGTPGPLSNTILAKNTGLKPDFYGRSSGANNSLIGISDETSGFINGQNGNIVGTATAPVDPAIGGLSDNGGGLPTHVLLSNSRAIDAGSNMLSIDRFGQPLTIDQRGYNRIINLMVDIGANEFNSQPVTTTSTIIGQVTNATGRGISGALISLRDNRNQRHFTMTNPFGFYRFVNVEPNLSYLIECLDKRNAFSAQIVPIEEDIEYINIKAS